MGNLLQWLFVPSNDFFQNNVDNIKYKISQKIPYQDYVNLFETIQQVQSGESIKIDLNNYHIANGFNFNFKNFIDFSWVTAYKDTWYAWVRGIVFVLLIIYNINQIMKLFRGYNVAEGISKMETSNSNNASAILSSGGGKK